MPILRTRDRSNSTKTNRFTVRPTGFLVSKPSAPVFIGVVGGISAGSSSLTWPNDTQAGDFAIFAYETAGDQTPAVPSGWTAFASSPVTDIADNTGSKLSVYYRTVPAGVASVSLPSESLDHRLSNIAVFRNVGTAAIATVTDTKAVASTSLTFPSIEAPMPNSLIVFIATHPLDTTSAQFSNLINTNLTDISERRDISTTNGNGGGMCIYTGVASSQGSIGTSAITLASSSTNACMVLAVEPSLAYPA